MKSCISKQGQEEGEFEFCVRCRKKTAYSILPLPTNSLDKQFHACVKFLVYSSQASSCWTWFGHEILDNSSKMGMQNFINGSRQTHVLGSEGPGLRQIHERLLNGTLMFRSIVIMTIIGKKIIIISHRFVL